MNTSATLPTPPACREVEGGGGGGGSGSLTPNANLGAVLAFCATGTPPPPATVPAGGIAAGTVSPAAADPALERVAEDPNVNRNSGVLGPLPGMVVADGGDAVSSLAAAAAAASARFTAAATVAAAAAAAAATVDGDGDDGAGIAATPLIVVPALLFGSEFQRPPAGCRAIEARPIPIRPSGVKYADAVEEAAEGGDICGTADPSSQTPSSTPPIPPPPLPTAEPTPDGTPELGVDNDGLGRKSSRTGL